MIHDRTPEPEERRLLHELDNAEKRIRELEAELSLLSQKPRENVVFWFTREHPHGMLTFEPNCTLCDLLARAEKAEARVAELSSAYDALVDDYNSLKRVTFAEREEG